jgi:hypothetical protein
MKKILLIIANILIIPPVAMYSYYTFSPAKQAQDNPPTITTHSSPRVLGATDEQDQIYFTVNIPATFKQDISAPNIVYSVNSKSGEINIDNSLVAGSGITIDGREITNSGILTLTAGDGITVDGNKITNSGITSLSAGTNISIDGNKINNIYSVDLTASGWTDSGTAVTLTTTTDTVTVGTLTTGAITASSLTVDGLSVLSGNATIGNGVAVLPSVDLGSDLGSTSLRFNNLWVANINSNSSQAFSGQTTFSYPPTDTTISEASVIINPTTSAASGQLLGLAIAGYQKALIDEDGDIILGYSDATSAPASDYPLNIYGHSGTRVSFVDTTGNAYFAGNVGVGIAGASNSLHVGSGSVTSGIAFGSSATNKIYSWNDGDFRIVQNNKIDLQLTNSSINFNASQADQDIALMWDTGTALFVEGSSGNVGIGGTTPTSKLHVSGAVTGKALAIFNETGDQDILTASASGTTKFVVGNSGNATIGGISGNQGQLYFGGTSHYIRESSGLWYFTGLAGEEFTIDLNAGSAAFLSISQGDLAFDNNAINEDIYFKVNDGGVDTEVMRLQGSTGNVGIGTTGLAYSPSKLDVNGTAHITGNLYLGPYNDYLSTNGFYGSDSAGFTLDSGGHANSPGTMLATSGVERMRITKTGLVGIGTTTPTSKLHVDGAVTGKALAIFNETGDQALLTASASGTPKFSILHNGLVDATVGGLATYTEAGTIDDTDFTDTAIDGLMGFDSTNGRLYIRNAGAWSYIAKTAGFQIPDYEAYSFSFDTDSFDTSQPLAEGDFLMPFVERKMADGALHGLYSKFSDVKGLLFTEENAQIASISSQLATLQPIDSVSINKNINQNTTLITTIQTTLTELSDKISSIFTQLSEVIARLTQLEKQTLAGTAIIPTYGTDVTITFDPSFESTPTITTTTDDPNAKFGIKDKTATGFTIYLTSPTDQDLSFSWVAVASDGSNVTVGNTTSSSPTATPADSSEPSVIPSPSPTATPTPSPSLEPSPTATASSTPTP